MIIIAGAISVFLCLLLIGALLYLIVWLYSLYDAYTTAEALNRGEILEDKLF
ncbi:MULTISPECIES: hypothetical protein [Methanobrevibacter]|uniref:hypothetical protein n=1 Tax=Methanobrevibacter TaxID=2172 RepID=UPI0025D0297C|nr:MULTISPECIES: hypothetical protein [Methanobrevibacter]MCI7428867.1 hypothetical protein [Methanobrevibacter sp.]MDY3096417.1 hypothetical protein [Methanobrevibacter sp.]